MLTRNVGLIGGSFDPPTTGHTQLANQILRFCPLDEVWLTPVYSHNHGKNLTPATHRLAMCELACKQDNRIKTFDYEVLHKIEGGTYNFISKLLSDPKYSQYKFHYVIGLDVANEFHRWSRYQDLQNLIPFVVHPRQGEVPTADWFLSPPHIYMSNRNSVSKISSTQIRKVLKNRNYLKEYDCTDLDYLPPWVFQYIEKNSLYV